MAARFVFRYVVDNGNTKLSRARQKNIRTPELSRYFLDGPRKFIGCRRICRPIKVRPLTIVQTPNFAERAVLGGGG